ncbi:hypothetical protein [Devosia sp.]|jgi:hypothetical protein|uniref:hypothetical protein n=1 Tax=Devosia sp. TaxID=1871048 RepID=UPI0037C1297C
MDSRRVLEIILEESGAVDERYEGYRKDLTEVVAEIVNIERQHRLLSRNVKKEIADQINTLGGDLAEKLAKAKS